MKIVKNKEKQGSYYFMTYELDRSFSVSEKAPGLLILYTVVKSSEFAVREIILDFFSDIHGGNTEKIYNKAGFTDRYPFFNEFCLEIDTENLAPWSIELEDGTMFSGGLNREIRVMYKEESANFNRAFYKVEEETYHYNRYPHELLEYLENREGMKEKLAVQILQGLEEYEDLYQEFASCIKDGEYTFPEHPIAVEGYTAKKLTEEVGFHPIGAYRSMLWLRKEPQKELENIRKGLIWK